ncbi:MAG: undecaprenyl/decaprenyl-phosphate alpha-N-acetylglucosaminyl 1-phosphate transferase, partial [Firmicutes bacterium]|nr:undecaprenyl/decaprenyl-phosphate alpha-N-acetylglucosaminyl 1-phosphate transferase [Bacillota bacterium]
GVFDAPDARKVHKKPMTRMGGLGIYCGFLAGFLVYGDFSREMLGWMLSCSFVVAVGFYDDVKNISPKLKFLGQIVAACILMAFGVHLEYFSIPFTDTIIDMGFFGYVISLLWLVGVCNAVNLIDGLDGLAGGVSAIAALSLGVVTYAGGLSVVAALCVILFGSILGFLRWNFNPAHLFMGDCGSLLLGFLLAVFSLMGISEGATLIGLAVPILILGIPILDTFFAIIRRKRSGKPIFQADKGHFHHLLLGMGLSHRDTVLFIYAVTFLFGAMALMITLLPTMYSILASFVVLLLIFAGALKLGILNKEEKTENE